MVKEITAKLTLDSANFIKGMGAAQATVLKSSAAVAGLTTGVLALAKSTADYQDDLGKQAHSIGVAADAFSELNYAAKLADIETQDLSKNMAKLVNPSAKVSESLSKIGVNIKNAQGSIKPANELLVEMAGAFEKMPDVQDRASVAMEIFGSRGRAMVNLLASGKTGLAEMADEARRFGLVVSEEAAANAETFNDSFTRLGSAIQGATNSFGESVIKFTNESGIMEKLSETVADLGQMWRDLDDGTKELILTIGTASVAIAGIAGAMALAIPVIGAISTPILATAAAMTAVGMAAAEAIKYWDQIEPALAPTIKIFSDLYDNAKRMASQIVDAVKSFMGLGESSKDNSREISILGTVIKGVFSYISTGLVVIINGFKIWYNVIAGIINAFTGLASTVMAFTHGQWKLAGKLAQQAYEDVKKNVKNIGGAIEGIADQLKNSTQNAIVYETDTSQLDKLRDSAKETNKQIDELRKNQTPAIKVQAEPVIREKSFMDSYSAFLDNTQKALVPLQVGVQIAGGFSDLASQEASRANEVLQRNLDKKILILQRQAEKENKLWEDIFKRQAELVANNYDDEIKALRHQENQKLQVQKDAANERKLARNQEYLDEKAAREAAFQKQLITERANYEKEKEILLQRAYDKEQARLVESVMDEDFKKYLESLQKKHDDNMSTFASEFTTSMREQDAMDKQQQEQNETDSAAKIEALTEKKNRRLAELEKKKDLKMQEIANKAADKEEKFRLKSIRKQWQFTKAEYENTKTLKKAEALVAGLAGAAQAAASMAALGPVGAAMGATAAAAIMELTRRKIAMIDEMKPVKPAELMMAKGGVVGGSKSHSIGGMNVNLESGEAVLDRARTEKFIQSADKKLSSNKVININFNNGAIQTTYPVDDPRVLEKLSRELAYRLEKII